MKYSDFVDWKQHPVTQVVFNQLTHRINELREELGESAGIDPLYDRYRAGYIASVFDLIALDFVQQEDNDE